MFIIISPSKTQKPNKTNYLEDKEMLYPIKHKKVLAALRKLKKNEIAAKMKLSKELLNQTYFNIKNYASLPESHAFESFDGFVFKGLRKDSYREQEYDYIADNVRILDAFYGILEPGTLIKPYRLDLLTNIGLNLYNHWNIDSYFKGETIINLASNEFSNMLHNQHMITIHFREYKDGSYKNLATYSKQARGVLLNYLILNKITDIEAIKSFHQEGYSFNQDLSDDANIVFSR